MNPKGTDGEDLLCEPKHIDLDGTYFLDCSYETAEALCSAEYTDDYPFRGCVDADGEKTEFRYRLARDWRCIGEERLLFDIADVYRIRKPVIFSPYSRRAVKIQLPCCESAAAERLQKQDAADLEPYLLKENGLQDKLLAGRQLLWNIGLGEVSLPQYNPGEKSDSCYVAPYGDREIYRYEFTEQKGGSFICPESEEMPKLIAAEKDVQKGQITLITRRLLSGKCRSLRIISPKDNIAEYKRRGHKAIFFGNIFDCGNSGASCFSAKERLRTRGDIERVLYGFNMPEHGYSCSFERVSDSAKTDLQVCRRYSADLSYGASCDVCREQTLYGTRRVLPFCHVRFSGETKFLVDYANYVLFFLENRYPDFRWVGVV